MGLGAQLLVAGCRPEPAAERPLEVVVQSEARLLDPRFTTGSLDIKLTRLVHAGLVGLHPNSLEPVPLVAEHLELDAAGGLEVRLRPGLRFHSGAQLQPEDVCATLAAIGSPELQSPHRGVVSAIGGCEVLGPLTLRIRLKEPRATLLTDLELPILRTAEVLGPPRPDGDLDGLGPYKISHVEFGRVELTPMDTGLSPKPARPLVVRTVRDSNARALRLLAGRADVAPNSLPPALLPALAGRDGLSVQRRPGANVTYLLLHNERPPFDRVEVRRALAEAIDRDILVETLLDGNARLARGIFPPGHWASPADLPPLEHAPERSRASFDGLGEVTLLTSTDRARVTLSRAIAQMLSDAGLEVRVSSLDLGALLERLDAGDYQVALLQMPELTEPHLLDWFFHRTRVPGEGRPGKNRARYRSQRAAELLDAGGRDRELALRAPHYHELARLMARDLPVVPLWHEDQIAVVSARARGFELSAEGRWAALAAIP